MGTSQSSRGPSSKVPIVPPWVPPLPEPPEEKEQEEKEQNEADSESPELNEDQGDSTEWQQVATQLTLAAPRRFGGTRGDLGRYADSGDRNRMKSGVGKYIRKGYGGVRHASTRLNSTAIVARGLISVLNGQPSDDFGSVIDRKQLRGKTPREIIDQIIETVRPIDGTQDSEVNRYSIKDALSELLKRSEDVDLLNLSEEHQRFVIQTYIASDIFRRFELDVGVVIHEKAPSISIALSRLKEVRDYIRETVAVSFRKIIGSTAVTAGNILRIVKKTLTNALQVFADFSL